MPDEPTEFEDFISKVNGYEKALREEYEVAREAGDAEKIRELIQKKLGKALPGLIDDLLFLSHLSSSDATRLNAIKYAFSLYFEKSDGEEDPFTKFLSEMTKSTESEESTT